MGAMNVLAAYAKYSGKVPPLSMVLLAYMAVVSMDSDSHPWFGRGHKALAEHALGRAAPIEEADVRAVERAIAPLLKVGAIFVDRRAAPRGDGVNTVRYRLNLRSDVPRKPWDERPTETVRDVPRFPAERPTESDETPHGNRGTEEYEETGGVQEEEGVDLHHLDTGAGNATDETTKIDQSAEEPPKTSPADDLLRNVMNAVGATPAEARALIDAVEEKHHPSDISKYMATMAKSGDLARRLAELRRTTTASGPPRFADLIAQPPCPHGMRGGDQIRPATGTPACPDCRCGVAADVPESGPPDREAAMAAVRAALGRRGVRRMGPAPVVPPQRPPEAPAVADARAYLNGRGDFDVWLTAAQEKLGDASWDDVTMLAAELARGDSSAAVGGKVYDAGQ